MASVYEKRILRVLDYIHANPAGDLSLDALADVAAMSRFHWHRVFHGMTGETLACAVRRIRLHRSACWLVQTEKPIAEIAAMAGFGNVQTYTRVFRQSYSHSPAAFRKLGELTSPYHPKSKGNPAMFQVEIKNSPARRVLAVPHRGPYMEISKAFEKLSAIVASRNLFPHARGMVGVYYDDPSAVKAADLRSHAGLVVDPSLPKVDGLEDVQLPGGRTAVLRFKGHYSGLPAAYDYLYGTWLPASGHEAGDSPVFEDYVNSPMDTAPENLLTDICLPLAN
jgi:AraC family transcriptional regulator